MADNTIDTLVIKVEGTDESAGNTLDKVIKKLESIQQSTSGASRRVSNFTKKLSSLKATVDSLKPQKLNLFSDSKVPSSVKQTTDSLNHLKETVNDLNGTETKVVSDDGLSKVKELSDRISDVKDDITSGTSKVRSFGKQIKDAFSGSVVGRFASRIKGVIGAFGRIAIYRLMRSIIKHITDAFSTGINNMYQYSLTFQGSFSKTMDRAASAMLSFKNSIGAAVAPLIEFLVPYLDKAVDKLMEINNNIAETIAGLTGKTTFSKAIRVTTQYAESANKAEKSTNKVKDKVEELKRSFAGLDEITVIGDISTPESPSSSIDDSTSSSIPDYSTMFVETPVDMGKINELKNKLDKILDIVKLIGLAFGAWKLGSFISKIGELFGALGGLKSLQLKAGLVLAVTGLTIMVKGLVDIIANGINWSNLAQTLTGGGLLIAGATLIGKSFGSSLLGAAIGAIIAGIPMFFVGIWDAINEGLNWMNALLIEAGATLAGAGIGAIIGMVGGPIGAGIGALIGLAVGALTDLVILVVQNWDAIVSWCSQALTDIGEFFVGIWDWICSVWNTAADWFDTNVIQPVAGFFSGMWDGISQTASKCWESITDFFSPAIKWFSELFSSVYQTISDIFYNIGVIASGCWEIIKRVWGVVTQFFTNIWNSIKTKASEAWEGIKSVYARVADWFDRVVITPVRDFFSDMWDGFVEKAKQAWNGVKHVFSVVADFFGNIFSEAWAKVVKVFSIAGDIFVNIRDGIINAFKKVVNELIIGINHVIAIPFNAINGVLGWIRDAEIMGFHPFGGIRLINVPEIPLLANGGTVNAGTAFIAGEAGPEVIAKIGNRTGVMNTDEMEESVIRGMTAANREQNALLREQNGLLRRLLEKDSSIDVSTIAKAFNQKNRRDGKVTVPVAT